MSLRLVTRVSSATTEDKFVARVLLCRDVLFKFRAISRPSARVVRESTHKVALTGESKGARDFTSKIRQQIKELARVASGSDEKVALLHQSLRVLERRQEEHNASLAAVEAKDEKLRQELKVRHATAQDGKLDLIEFFYSTTWRKIISR